MEFLYCYLRNYSSYTYKVDTGSKNQSSESESKPHLVLITCEVFPTTCDSETGSEVWTQRDCALHFKKKKKLLKATGYRSVLSYQLQPKLFCSDKNKRLWDMAENTLYLYLKSILKLAQTES